MTRKDAYLKYINPYCTTPVKSAAQLHKTKTMLLLLEEVSAELNDIATIKQATKDIVKEQLTLAQMLLKDVDDKGREERTVVLDEERAPLIKIAFEKYATDEWTIADLAEHIAACGLTTKTTPKIPSEPINAKSLNKILVNPYYKGAVIYKGVEHEGAHEAIVSLDVWEKTQQVLEAHLNGERTRKHPHFLKGSVFCATCGSRLLVSNEKKKNGDVYPYFVCGGRHSKRVKDCEMKAVLINVVEKHIERIYDSHQLPSEIREPLEEYLLERIHEEKAKFNAEIDGLKKEKAKLEHKRKKLLEAHYSDAIPLDLMKSEQKTIAKELATIQH